LKAVQPYLETALRVESEISQKPFETLQKELETMVDNSVETGRPAAAPNREEPIEEADDTIMVDAPQALQITVKGSLPEEEDAMDTGEDGDEDGGNIEVNTSGLGIIDEEDSKVELHNGIKSSDTPPDTDGYVSRPRPVQSGPPTPPQSNGSLGLDPADPLTEGGVLWYLKGHEPRGTSVLGEHWAGRDAVRMLSEDLTDMDDEELKGLGMDVDHGVSSVAVEVNGHVDAETTAAKSKASKVKKRRTSTRRR
jgi:NuA3 HAT complex component NTO1